LGTRWQHPTLTNTRQSCASFTRKVWTAHSATNVTTHTASNSSTKQLSRSKPAQLPKLSQLRHSLKLVPSKSTSLNLAIKTTRKTGQKHQPKFGRSSSLTSAKYMNRIRWNRHRTHQERRQKMIRGESFEKFWPNLKARISP
jgi:hypothetical protein